MIVDYEPFHCEQAGTPLDQWCPTCVHGLVLRAMHIGGLMTEASRVLDIETPEELPEACRRLVELNRKFVEANQRLDSKYAALEARILTMEAALASALGQGPTEPETVQ